MHTPIQPSELREEATYPERRLQHFAHEEIEGRINFWITKFLNEKAAQATTPEPPKEECNQPLVTISGTRQAS